MTHHDAAKGHRLRHIVVALLPIVLVFGLLNVGLMVIWGAAPATLSQSESIDPDTLQSISERVASVERQWENAGPTHSRLAVVMGLSTAREGIDPILIHQATQGGLHLLNVAASGGSFREMRTYSEALLNSGLQPDLVIMAVHPCWLAGRQLRPSPESPPFLRDGGDDASAQTRFQQLKRWAAQQVWVLDNRPAMHSELRQFMLGWRARLHHWMNISLIEQAPRGDDPWSVRIAYQDQQAPPEFLQAQLREWASAGWFDPERFGVQTAEAQVLRRLLGDIRGKTRNLVIVLMPESEAFRSRVPSRAAETLIDIVQAVDNKIAVLDLRASLPAAMFRDQAHLNAQGRRALTQEIAARVFGTPTGPHATSSNSSANQK